MPDYFGSDVPRFTAEAVATAGSREAAKRQCSREG